ncbi:hypothetical protein VUR80DRAFT_4296 [Thermomyces stellatus]
MADQEPREQSHKHDERPTLASTAHAVRVTQSWKPSFARRQSWTPEDRKRDSQMGAMAAQLPEGHSQVLGFGRGGRDASAPTLS